MAGNIPFAGFHDMLCVLICGHRFLGKISSKDGNLMDSVITMLCEINPEFTELIELTDVTVRGFDAVLQVRKWELFPCFTVERCFSLY